MKCFRELPSSVDMSKKRGSKSEKPCVKADDGTNAGISKSPSDVGFLGRHFSGLSSKRSQSHSADNLSDTMGKRLSTISADKCGDVKCIDSQRFEAIVNFVSCLLDIESRLDSWLSSVSASWHNVVDIGREKKPRCRLKSKCIDVEKMGIHLEPQIFSHLYFIKLI